MNRHAPHAPHVTSVQTYLTVFGLLLLLLLATVGAAHLPLGPLNFPVAMAIATTKAALIVLFFMHLLHSHRLNVLVSVAAFLWLALLLAFTVADYLSRGWIDVPGK